jgi:CRP/FNR family transcriptional regulator, cyclic AMP receptor protein
MAHTDPGSIGRPGGLMLAASSDHGQRAQGNAPSGASSKPDRSPAGLIACLSLVPCFGALPEGDRQALAEVCRRRSFKPGEVLFYEGDLGSALYLLLSGQVKIVRETLDGAEIILHICGPGECVGEMAVIDGAARSATARAMERAEVLMLYRDDFLALMERRPAFARAVMGALAVRIRRLDEQVQTAVTLDVPARLAKVLLTLAEQHGRETPDGIHIALRLTHEELAQMVGAARQTVTSQLTSLRERGIVSLDREGITLHRPDLLRRRIY